ncbi:hypothetical protein pb186bvf_007016 [Paramecium bursaria]
MQIPPNANALDYYALMNITRNLNIDDTTKQISIQPIFIGNLILNLQNDAITGEYLPEGIFEGFELFILITIILLKGFQIQRIQYCEQIDEESLLSQKKNYIFFVIIGLFMIFNDGYYILSNQHQYLAYINSMLRPLFIILQSRPLQLVIRNYISVILESYEILIVFVFNVLIFAAIGKLTFENDDNFGSMKIFLMFIALISNADAPDVDFYGKSKYSAFYFISFQMINTLILFNFVISNFYCQYEIIFRKEFEQQAEDIQQSIKIQYSSRRYGAKIRISKSLMKSRLLKQFLEDVVQNKYVQYATNLFYLLDFVLIFFINENEDKFLSDDLFNYINLGLNLLILFDQIIKLLYYTNKYYISVQNKKKNLNRILVEILNIVITLTIITLTILHKNFNQDILLQFVGYLMISRLLRPTKFYLKSKYIDFLLIFFMEIGPYLLEFFGIIIIYMFYYSTIGQFLFNECDKFQKYSLNFNDNMQSIVTTWHLLIISQWKDIKDKAIECRENSQWYFVTYYILVNILSFNVTLALLINYMVLKWRSFKLEQENVN